MLAAGKFVYFIYFCPDGFRVLMVMFYIYRLEEKLGCLYMHINLLLARWQSDKYLIYIPQTFFSRHLTEL